MTRHFKIPLFIRRALRKRRTAAILTGLVALIGWSAAGSHIISSLNPSLRHELSIAMHPALDVWITPPDYAGASPIIISTPAATLYQQDTLTIPQGSTVSAHLAEQDGDAPELIIDGIHEAFTADAHGDFAATEKLTSGSMLAIKRGSHMLARWKINIIPENPAKITMTEPPSVTSGKTLRVAYRATDDFGVTEVAVRITPRDPLPGANNKPVEIALPVNKATEITRVDFTDMTEHPWAGQPVSLQLVATNIAGQRSLTAPIDFTLPERSFFHPVARVLIEERKKLMQHPDDESLREETANVMAGIAHETGDYHGDPVILMALRAGAVRLILDRGHDTALSVNDLLWQAATRIEDGNTGQAERMLRDARQDLADAIQNNASRQEIQLLNERLEKTMVNYLADLSMHRNTKGAQSQANLSRLQ